MARFHPKHMNITDTTNYIAIMRKKLYKIVGIHNLLPRVHRLGSVLLASTLSSLSLSSNR
jgi:hypothetical protein